MAVGPFLRESDSGGGGAYGKRARGESPAVRGYAAGSPLAAGLHRPKRALAARKAPERLA